MPQKQDQVYSNPIQSFASNKSDPTGYQQSLFATDPTRDVYTDWDHPGWAEMTNKVPLANCGDCPLRPNPLSKPLAVGAYGVEGKGEVELILAFPCKPDAVVMRFVQYLLHAVNVSHTKVAFVQTVQCDLSRGAHWPPPDAVEACADEFRARIDMIRCNTPELRAELDGYIAPITYPPPIIAFGQEVLDAFFGVDEYNLSTIRGASLWYNGHRVVPTWLLGTLISQPGRFQDVARDFENVIKYPIYVPPDDSDETIKWEIAYGVHRIKQFHEDVLNTTGRACLDLETSGFDSWNDKILCIALGWGDVPYRALIIPQELCYSQEGRVELTKLFEDPEIDWVFQNGKFDIRFLKEQLRSAPQITEDTLLLHYTLDERVGTHGLKQLSQEKLGVPDYERELHKHLKRKADSYDTIPTNVLYKYAALDVIYTLQLFDRLMLELHSQPGQQPKQLLRLYRFLIKAENVFTEVEQNGMVVDREETRKVAASFGEIRDNLRVQLQEIVGDGLLERVKKSKTPIFNPNSWQQVQHYIYKVCKMPSPRLFRKHKEESTAREAIDKLLDMPQYIDNVFLRTLITYRMVQKILSTYVAPLDRIVNEDGRLRSDFMLFGTVTGRLSSARPNLMNIPRVAKNDFAKPIRSLFIAPPDHVLVYADYSQAELRVLAQFCQDPFLLEVFRTGRDLHAETSVMLFGENYKSEDRMIAKMLNFGLVYGRTAHSIAVERNMPLSEAEDIVRNYFARMLQVKNWLEKTRDKAVEQGYLTTPTGRIRRFGLITDTNLQEIRNQASNFPISSTASDICLTALMTIHEELKQRRLGKVCLMVHDSILAECRKEDAKEVEAIMIKHMAAAPLKIIPNCTVPFKVDSHVGLRWGDLA